MIHIIPLLEISHDIKCIIPFRKVPLYVSKSFNNIVLAAFLLDENRDDSVNLNTIISSNKSKYCKALMKL